MKEEFLHWVWKNRFFDAGSLCDSEAGPIEVITPGDYNRDSGPDFFNTRLVVGGTVWAGNTEIHVNASDWYRHGHHTDHAYDNVILHLVHNDDADVYTASGRRLLTARPWSLTRHCGRTTSILSITRPRWPVRGLIGKTDGFMVKALALVTGGGPPGAKEQRDQGDARQRRATTGRRRCTGSYPGISDSGSTPTRLRCWPPGCR